MALVKCSECWKEVSSSADKCPHCGYKPTSGLTWAVAILAGVVLIGLIFAMLQNEDRRQRIGDAVDAAMRETREGAKERQKLLATENVEWIDGAFTGVVRNNGALAARAVKVAVEFTDDNGVVLERAGDSTGVLGGGDAWRFRIYPPRGSWKHANLKEVSCE